MINKSNMLIDNINTNNNILLLVEDRVAAEKFRQALQNFAYNVSIHTGRKNLVSVLLKQQPQLIIMNLPPGSEESAINVALDIYNNYHISFIFLVSPASKKDIEKKVQTWMFRCIETPIIEKELIAEVEFTFYRTAMEIKVLEREKKFLEFSNSTLQTIIECNLDGKITEINNYGLAMFGIDATNISKGVYITDYVKENSEGSILDVCKKSSFIDASGLNREFEMTSHFGKSYVIEEMLTPVYTEFKLSGFRGILIDITSRKLKQDLYQIFKSLHAQFSRVETTISEITTFVVDKLKEKISGTEKIYFLNYSANDKSVGVQSSANVNPKNIQVDVKSITLTFEIKNPIESCGAFVFVVSQQHYVLSHEDHKNLLDFFDDVNFFIEKVMYQKALKRSENMLSSFVGSVDEAVIQIDLDSRIMFANERMSQLSGYKFEDVIGQKCESFLTVQDQKTFSQIFENRKKGQSSKYQLPIKTKSGEYRNFYIKGVPYRDENEKITGAVGALSEIKATKTNSSNSVFKHNILFDALPKLNIGLWIYSNDTKKFVYLSKSLETIFEATLETVYKQNSMYTLVHPEDKTIVARKKELTAQAEKNSIQYRIVTPNGSLKWIQEDFVSTKDVFGKTINITGYIQDISEIKLKEEKFKQSETEQDLIIKSLPESFIMFSDQGEILNAFFKPSEREILKVSSKRLIGAKISKVFNEDLLITILEKAQTTKNTQAAELFELSFVVNSKTCSFEARMIPLNNRKVLMMLHNITQTKNNISTIQKLFNITEQTRDIIIITDASGKIEYVNPMFSTVTGYSSNEVLGHNVSILKSKKHNKVFFTDLWRSLAAGEVYKGVFYNTKKTGELFIEEKIITPYLNLNGEITNFISTGRDVTSDRKNAISTHKHQHLENTLLFKQRKSRTLSLIQSHENERRKFAHEIHEGLNQTLSVASMNLQSIGNNEWTSAEQKTKIESVNKLFAEIIQQLRGISGNLSPAGLFEFGLYSVIKQMCTRLNKQISPASILFKSNLQGIRFAEDIEINFYRIIQEALKNVFQHAQANKITLNLSYTNKKLIFLIKDNGRGINKNQLEIKKKKTTGISAMEERALAMGAQIEFTSNKDNGFEINMEVIPKKILYDKNISR